MFCVADEEMQVWKSPSGHSFKGEFVALEAGNVLLEGEDGREISVPLVALDANSQLLANEAAAEAAKYPTLLTYSNPSVALQVRPQSNGEIFQLKLLEGGQPIPHYGKVIVRIRLSEHRPSKNNKTRLHRIPLKKVIPEKVEREKGTFRLLYENGVVVLLKVKGLKDGASFSYEMEDPPPGLPKLRLHAGSRFPRLLDYDMKTKTYKGILSPTGVSFEQLESLLSDYKMIILDRKGNRKTFGFDTSPKRPIGSGIILQTPARQDIRFEVEGGGLVHSSFYGGKKAIEGFGIRYGNSKKMEDGPPEFSIGCAEISATILITAIDRLCVLKEPRLRSELVPFSHPKDSIVNGPVIQDDLRQTAIE